MKKIISILLVMALMLSFVACSTEDKVEEKSVSTTEENIVTESDTADQLYIEVSALGNLDYFYDHKMGMEKVGEELGVRTEYVGPAEYDMNAMITAFEQAISKKPDGIVVVGFEQTLDSIVNKAIAEGIPVVTVDADLPSSDRLAFVGTGNIGAGMEGGKYLASIIEGSGQVAIMTKPGQSNLEERAKGYEQAFALYPDIEVVQIVDTQSDPVIAAQAAATLLQKYPDLKGIVCVEAAGGSGAATAVREAGKTGEVKIIAMDRGNEVLEGIEEGVITASVAQQTALMPYYAVQILYNLRNSNVKITEDNASAGVLGIPATVDTGVVMITEENYMHFKR